jgi:putative transcriptional regulator
MGKENIRFEGEISEEAKRSIKCLRDGCILLSTDALEDPNFKTTIVLLCIYNKEGVIGLVLNRPSSMPIGEVFDVGELFRFDKRSFYIGGPVQQDALHIIQLADTGAQNAYLVAPKVHLGGEWTSVEDILNESVATTRLFLGYSGWSCGQLEAEIREGAWEAYTIDTFSFIRDWEKPLFSDYASIRNHLQALSVSYQKENH